MACDKEHKYIIGGTTYDTAEEADKILEERSTNEVTAYHPGLIDTVMDNPEARTYCPEETKLREEPWSAVDVTS